jgi:hypothetical protein
MHEVGGCGVRDLGLKGTGAEDGECGVRRTL